MESIAIKLEKMKTVEQLLPPRGANIYSSGLRDSDKAEAKYGPASSDQPTLIINNYIIDNDGDMITPGYYELALSRDRQTFLLTQSQKLVATFPVFKIEEDKSQAEVTQPRTKKEQKKADKAKKKVDKKIKKKIESGELTGKPEIYNNATIEYVTDGDYYLVKYERGRIKAWGAIKF